MSDSKKTGKRRKLDTWKEISDYLNRDVRTVQRWEARLGLPVHRLDSSPRSRVFSYTDEIDRWMEKSLGSAPKKDNPEIRKKPALGIVLAAFFIPALVVGLIWVGKTEKNTTSSFSGPVDFQLSGSKLSVLNTKGRPIWSHVFDTDKLENEAHYKVRFQEKKCFDYSFYLPCIMFKDLNGDGNLETLFAMQTLDNSLDNRMICFGPEGDILWEFDAESTSEKENDASSEGYRISGFDAVDIDGNGTVEILILANHLKDFSGRAVFLNGTGEKIGIYENSGHFEDYVMADIDGDSSNEILLAGLNTDWGQPCLAVLDHTCLNGFSPPANFEEGETDESSSSGKYYILMPIHSVCTICGARNGVKKILLSDNPDQMLTLSDLVEYTFNSRLELTDISFSHRFLLEYQDMKKNGLVDMDPSSLREALLAEGASFYLKPGTWSKTPAIAKPVPSL
jgi:hypothetical protein